MLERFFFNIPIKSIPSTCVPKRASSFLLVQISLIYRRHSTNDSSASWCALKGDRATECHSVSLKIDFQGEES
jgi:hypothetical protein